MIKTILQIGAGRSTQSLIEYLLQHSESGNFKLKVVDLNLNSVIEKYGPHPNFEAEIADATQESVLNTLVAYADLVISMLPAYMHIPVAQACIKYKTHLVTASYATKEMLALDQDAKSAGAILFNEIGVDPGIDHLSAMKMIDEVKELGAEITLFESFTGGLPAPESDNNPWNYKFSWNPRNVVLAGAGGAVKFKQEGMYKYIPYHMLFRRTEKIEIPEYGKFEGYANRDSLHYRNVYGLNNIDTLYRGTLRRPGFCRAWDAFVKLGMTDDSYLMEHVDKMTKREFLNSFLAYHPTDSVELKLMHYLNIPQDILDIPEKFEWLGLFSQEPIGLKQGTPAQILQHILEEKWKMEPHDKDMIVMWHKLGYRINGELKMIHSYMITEGVNAQQTAMARTVGLPLGMVARRILNGEITKTGVQLPVYKEVYNPLLQELKEFGIHFNEVEVPYQGY